MLELRDVTAGYGQTNVLRDVSLTVPDGKVVALLGPNGAGKTTLLRVASRVLDVEGGSVSLGGEDVSHLKLDALARRGVCHVPEGRGVFPSLTVKENLLLFAYVNGVDDPIETAVEALPPLKAHLKQVAGTLSGGQKQMLALARTCVSKPKLILLDEVSLGLAPKIVDELFAFLRRLASTGVSLLLVEQYFNRALDLADKVYMLNRGRVVFTGEPSELDADSIIRSYISLDV